MFFFYYTFSFALYGITPILLCLYTTHYTIYPVDSVKYSACNTYLHITVSGQVVHRLCEMHLTE